ncbi:hypothetical protein LPJ66_006516 [Kickxella alabastrina]|uniref:Uncharacterized protein n=1 Tax=Kickxella alabastrina TaxID=61397 RepID=A0ACC1IC30_9FUNG|nr:hypothetical protein LPJ66_006516 [Kickxella alabastrina]
MYSGYIPTRFATTNIRPVSPPSGVTTAVEATPQYNSFFQHSQFIEANNGSNRASVLESGYDALMRTMSQVLTHGPPVDRRHEALRMVDDLCRGSPAKDTEKGMVLDEEKLLRLYTRSETLLPNGLRARNLLWRMDGRRLKNPKVTVLSGPLTESPKTAAVHDFDIAFMSADHLVGSQQQNQQQQQQSLDIQRRSSSHTLFNASDQTLGFPAITRMQMQMQQPHSYMSAISNPTQDNDLDLELARPLELWDIPSIDMSLFYPPNPSQQQQQQQQSANTTIQYHSLSLPFAPTSAPPIGQTPVIVDTRFIDARSSASTQSKARRNSSLMEMRKMQQASMMDLDILRSPTSLGY